jgi:hypothetical protein
VDVKNSDSESTNWNSARSEGSAFWPEATKRFGPRRQNDLARSDRSFSPRATNRNRAILDLRLIIRLRGI